MSKHTIPHWLVRTLKAAALVSLIATPWPALAAVYGGDGLKEGILAAAGLGGITSIDNIFDLILTIINFILNIILLIAVLAIIVAGVYLIVSNGDETQKDKAKKIVIYVIIGIILILFAKIIVSIVNNIFG